MKSFMQKSFAIFLTMALLFSVLPLTAFAATPDEAEPGVIYVSEEDVQYGFYWAVQSALNEARENATEDLPYTVIVPEGEYNLGRALRIYSNTTLVLQGVTLTRSDSGNMLRVGDEDSESYGVTGYAYENIRLIGGIFDGNMGENTIIKAFHTKGFLMDGVTLLNEKDGHMMEYAGVDGLTIRNCTFKDQYLSKGKYGYEVIQLDVLQSFHITNARSEDLPMTNVLVENCSFDNVPRAVGSHTAVHNRPHDNIVIRNNMFTNIGSIAVQGMGWTNVNILSNAIVNAPRGITVYAEPGGCTYLPSVLAKEGGTTAHASDSYQKPSKANINIAYNVLTNVGNKDDIYASYSSQGIAVLGEKLSAKSPVESSDKSGGLPAGDYYLDGVSIHDNFIDIRGNGIRVEDARNVEIRSNEILCSKNTVHSDNYYGIVLRSNVTASAVSFNTIIGAEVNGIQLDGSNGGSVDTMQYNRIESTGKYGIGTYAMKITNIYDNDIIGTKNIGLFMGDKSTASAVNWNRIRNCSAEGIWITSNSKASTLKSNTTVKCSGSNSYGGSTVGSNYTSSAALTKFYLPWTESKAGTEMGVGTMFKITPDVRPTNAFATFSYQSSDPETVYVDEFGMVYALQEGFATITVTSNNGIKMTYPVAVEGDKAVTHVANTPKKPVLILGDADGNGAVESIDAALVQRSICRIDVPVSVYTLARANVDGSDYLDIYDVTCIQRYLAGLPTDYAIGEKY